MMGFGVPIGVPAPPGPGLQFLQIKPNELYLFDKLFSVLDPQGTGVVSGGSVSQLFITSNLEKKTLASIWNLASRGRPGGLSRDAFFVACRLVAIAQQNLPLSEQTLQQHVELPLPMFYGAAQKYYPPSAGPVLDGGFGLPQPQMDGLLNPPPPARSFGLPEPLHAQSLRTEVPNRSTGPNISAPVGPIAATDVTDEDIWKISDAQHENYLKFFDQADRDKDGFVNGKEAKEFFSLSKLSSALLREIWLLSDVDRDNKLSREEFLVAMHLTMTVRMKAVPLPTILPQALQPRYIREVLDKTASSALPLGASMTEPLIAGSSTVQVPDLLRFDSTVPPIPNLSIDVAGPPQMTEPVEKRGTMSPGTASAAIMKEVRLDRAKEDVAKFEKHKSGLQEKIVGTEKQLEAVEQRRSDFTSIVEDTRSQLEFEQSRLDALRHRLEQEKKTLQTTQEEVQARHKELEEMRASTNEFNERVEQIKQELTDQELALACAEEELTDVRTNYKHAKEVCDYQQAILDRAVAEKVRVDAEVAELKDRIAKTKAKTAEMKTQTAEIHDTVKAEGNQRKTMQLELDAVKDERARVQQKVHAAQPEVKALSPGRLEWPASTGFEVDDADFTFPEFTSSISPESSTKASGAATGKSTAPLQGQFTTSPAKNNINCADEFPSFGEGDIAFNPDPVNFGSKLDNPADSPWADFSAPEAPTFGNDSTPFDASEFGSADVAFGDGDLVKNDFKETKKQTAVSEPSSPVMQATLNPPASIVTSAKSAPIERAGNDAPDNEVNAADSVWASFDDSGVADNAWTAF